MPAPPPIGPTSLVAASGHTGNETRPAAMAGRAETGVSTGQLDAVLQMERLPVGPKRTLHQRLWSELPDYSFVLTPKGPALVEGDSLTTWTAEHGYGPTAKRPDKGFADVITTPTVASA